MTPVRTPTRTSFAKKQSSPNFESTGGGLFLKSRRKRHPKSGNREDEDEDDSMALPQFCAVCEKAVLSTSMLYCSDSCRQKDSNHTSPTLLFVHDVSKKSLKAYQSMKPNEFGTDAQLDNIPRPDFSSDEHHIPMSPQIGQDQQRPRMGRRESEAAMWLAEFRRNPPSPPRSRRASPSREASPGLPYSPASSLGSHSSARRALPQRHPPWSAAYSLQSADLVTPLACRMPVSRSLNEGGGRIYSAISEGLSELHIKSTISGSQVFHGERDGENKNSLHSGTSKEVLQFEKKRVAPKTEDHD